MEANDKTKKTTSKKPTTAKKSTTKKASTTKKPTTKKTTTAKKSTTKKASTTKKPTTKKPVVKKTVEEKDEKILKQEVVEEVVELEHEIKELEKEEIKEPMTQQEVVEEIVELEHEIEALEKEEEEIEKEIEKRIEKINQVDEDIDVADHIKTIFETREEEKKSIKSLKIIIIFIILAFVLFFSIDLITNKKRFKQAKNPEKPISIKLDVTMKIEDYVGKNKELSDFYLDLIGYDNSNQVTHPKVIRFDKKWNGYKYWVAYTPYPYGDAAKENPFVMVSNDLVNWETIKKHKNPLDEPEDKDASQVYNSDTHLVYIEETDTLECYWRYVNDKTHKVIVYKRTTKDGVNWTKKEVFLESDRREEDYLSPAILYKNKKYLVWYVDRDLKVKYTEYDTENDKWATPVAMDISFEESPIVKPWHLDVIETEKGYEMILVGFYEWNNRGNMHLYYTKSEDNEKWDRAKTILNPNENSGLYRSSILFVNNTYYIFYSDIVAKKQRGVGIVYGTDIEHLNGLKSEDKEKFIDYIKLNG